MKDSTEYHYLTEDIKQIVEQRENTRVSLNEEKRIAERDVADLREKQREEERDKDGEDTDLFLSETEHILGDYLLMIHPGTMLATP